MTAIQHSVEHIHDSAPESEANPRFMKIVSTELHGLVDFRNPAFMLGRWATLGLMVAGMTEAVQMVQH